MPALDPIPLFGATLRWPEGVVERDGRRIALSERERIVLAALVDADGEPVARDTLARALGSEVRQRSVDFAMRRLRTKVEMDPSAPRHLLTVHGAGYRFVPERTEPAFVALPCRRWSLADGWVDVDAGLVVRNGTRDRLSKKELDVFQRLAAASPEPVDRATLAREVWGRRATSALRYVDQVVHRIRAKLEPDPSDPTVVVTLPRVGLALRSAPDPSRPRPRLPVPVTPFLGRSELLTTVTGALETGARLVTLVGPGGVGKTRLALEVAARHPPQAAFAELADARSRGGLLEAVAEALDVPLRDDPVAQLGRVLAGGGPLLLVLDTMEHVVEILAEVVGGWLRHAPNLTVLATSRERLGVPGERVVPVPPMPPAGAVALFAYYATAAQPGFRLSPTTRPAVASLVDLLDRLPLALELVAPRLRAGSVQTLLEQVREGLEAHAPRARTSRHATLTAALSWGWALLSTAERSTLAQLTSFERAFELGWALAVVELEPGDPDVLDVLQGLIDKSWLHLDGEDRLRILHTTRAYVQRQREPLARRTAERRHGAFFAAWGRRERRAQLDGPDGARIIASYLFALDDLVVAVPRALVRGDVSVALGALEAAWAVIRLRGPLKRVEHLLAPFSDAELDEASERTRGLVEADWRAHAGASEEARALYERLRADAPAESQAGLARKIGWLLGLEGQLKPALVELDRALELARARQDHALEAACLASSAMIHERGGDSDAARDVTLAALAAYRRAGNRRGEGAVLSNLGLVAMRQGRFGEALGHYGAALEACREVDDRYSEAVAMANLGLLQMETGHLDEARTLYGRALTLTRQVGHRLLEGNLSTNLGSLELRRGALDRAELHAREALEVHRETGHLRAEGLTLALLGQVDAAQQRDDAASQRYDAALVALERAADEPGMGEVEVIVGRWRARRGDLSAARRHFASASSRLQNHPPQLATCLARWAEALAEAGHTGEARSMLARAQTLDPPEESEAARLIARLRPLVG